MAGRLAGLRRWLPVIIGIAVIALATTALTFFTIPRPWTAIPTIASIIAGAWLGKYLQDDRSAELVSNQARPAIRHLFDQIDRLRALVIQADSRVSSLVQRGSEHAQSADWFEGFSFSLRSEIESTASAIEHWGDLSPDVQATELAKYQTRSERLPSTSKNHQQGAEW